MAQRDSLAEAEVYCPQFPLERISPDEERECVKSTVCPIIAQLAMAGIQRHSQGDNA